MNAPCTKAPTATFPTPYGVSVPVFDHPSEPGEYIFSMDATAKYAGIYDPKARARFAAECAAAGHCDMKRLPEYGGGPVPRVALSRPSSPAYPQIPKGDDFAIPIENWVTALMDRHRWCDRGEKLVEIIAINFDGHTDSSFEPILALGLQIMLTGALEHLAETEIDCLEAAAFYALSTHPEWSGPAARWLEPYAETWWADWIATRPAFARLASLCDDLPAWFRRCA